MCHGQESRSAEPAMSSGRGSLFFLVSVFCSLLHSGTWSKHLLALTKVSLFISRSRQEARAVCIFRVDFFFCSNHRHLLFCAAGSQNAASTPIGGLANGVHYLYIDNEIVCHADGLRFHAGALDLFGINAAYVHGSATRAPRQREQSMYIDNFVVSTRRVGAPGVRKDDVPAWPGAAEARGKLHKAYDFLGTGKGKKPPSLDLSTGARAQERRRQAKTRRENRRRH